MVCGSDGVGVGVATIFSSFSKVGLVLRGVCAVANFAEIIAPNKTDHLRLEMLFFLMFLRLPAGLTKGREVASCRCGYTTNGVRGSMLLGFVGPAMLAGQLSACVLSYLDS